MKITFVRHGDTESSESGLCQRFSESLSDAGRNQAKKIAEALKDETYDMVYVSTMRRAIETAEQILIYHPEAKIIYDASICEYNSGEWEGKSREWRAIKRREIAKKLNIHIWEVRPPKGESQKDVKHRVKEFFGKLKMKKLKSILIVSHSTPIFFILYYLLNLSLDDWDKYHLNPGEYLIIMGDKKNFRLAKISRINHVKH